MSHIEIREMKAMIEMKKPLESGKIIFVQAGGRSSELDDNKDHLVRGAERKRNEEKLISETCLMVASKGN